MDDSNTPSAAALDERLQALEDRVRVLEAHRSQTATRASAPAASTASGADDQGTSEPASIADPLWAVAGLKDHAGSGGGIVFAGDLPHAPDGPVTWQWGRPTAYFDDLDFTAAAGALDALGHPVRLGLLQEIHRGTTSVAGLSELGLFGSTGQIYHHLQQLAAAGWLESPQRGQWRIPAHRLVPVLTIILAARG